MPMDKKKGREGIGIALMMLGNKKKRGESKGFGTQLWTDG